MDIHETSGGLVCPLGFYICGTEVKLKTAFDWLSSLDAF